MLFYQVTQKHERVFANCHTFMSDFLVDRYTFMSESELRHAHTAACE